MIDVKALARPAFRPTALHRASLGLLWRHRFAVALTLILANIFLYRVVALRSQPALGLDAGNYLLTMRQLFGESIGSDGRRPPVIGLVLWPLVQVLGPLEASKLLAVAASVMLGIPFYLLCSRLAGRWAALAAASAFVFSTRFAEAVSWGYLSLIGITGYLVNFILIHDIVTSRRGSWGKVLALGLASAALIGLNQISALVYVATAALFCVLLIATGKRLTRTAMFRLVPAGAVALVFSLPLIPFYLNQSGAVTTDEFFQLSFSPDRLRQNWEGLTFFFGDSALLWIATGAISLAAIVLLLRDSSVEGLLVLALAAAPLALRALLGGEVGVRAAYFLYVPLWLGFGLALQRVTSLIRGRQVLLRAAAWPALGAMAFLGYLAVAQGHDMLLDAKAYYGYLSPDHLAAMREINQVAPSGTGVAYPVGLGWWTEGIIGRDVLEIGWRDHFPGREWQSETLTGSALLAGNHVTTNGSVFLADAYPYDDVPMDPSLGVDYGVLVRLFLFDDRLTSVAYSDGRDVRQLSLAEGVSLESRREVVGDTFIDRRTYQLGSVVVTKSVVLPEQGEQVSVELDVQSRGGFVEAITIPVKAARDAILVESAPLESAFLFRGMNPFRGSWAVRAGVRLAADPATARLTANEDGNLVTVQVTPRAPSVTVRLDFVFQTDGRSKGGSLQSFESSDVIRDRQISFLLLDTRPDKPWFGDRLDETTLAWLEHAPFLRRVSERGGILSYVVCDAGVLKDSVGCQSP